MSSGRIEKLSKKEALEISREHQKLMESIGGIKNMKGLPDALFVIDVKHEKIAVTEAQKNREFQFIGLVDTNSNPEGIDVVIPGNDDAIRSIKLILEVIGEACERGLESKQGYAPETSSDESVPVIHKVSEVKITSGSLNLVDEATKDDFLPEESIEETNVEDDKKETENQENAEVTNEASATEETEVKSDVSEEEPKKRKLKKAKKEKPNGNKGIPSKRTKRTFWCWNDGMQESLSRS